MVCCMVKETSVEKVKKIPKMYTTKFPTRKASKKLKNQPRRSLTIFAEKSTTPPAVKLGENTSEEVSLLFTEGAGTRLMRVEENTSTTRKIDLETTPFTTPVPLKLTNRVEPHWSYFRIGFLE